MLQSAPVLISPDYEKPFKLIIDASDIGAGGAVVQEDTQETTLCAIFLRNF